MLADLKPFFAGAPLINVIGLVVDGAPTATRALAAIPDFDNNELLLVVSERLLPRSVLDGLVGVASLAVTMVKFPAHECYQAKGRLLEVRALSADERAENDRAITKVSELCVMMGGPDHWFPAFHKHERVLARMSVDEIFHQTPGAGTGAPLEKAA